MKETLARWTPQEWTAVITAAVSALTTLVVSIINAYRGQRLEDKVDAHEVRAQARHESLTAGLPPSRRE